MSENRLGSDTGQHLSLKDYVGLILLPIQNDLANVRSAIEKLTITQANVHEIDSLKLQVASLSEGTQELEGRLVVLEKRLIVLESHDGISTWIFRSVVTIGTALLIGFLASLM